MYVHTVPVILEGVVQLQDEGVVHLHQQPPLVHDVVLQQEEEGGTTSMSGSIYCEVFTYVNEIGRDALQLHEQRCRCRLRHTPIVRGTNSTNNGIRLHRQAGRQASKQAD